MKTKLSFASCLAVTLCGFTLNKIPALIAIIAMPLLTAEPQPGSVDLTFDAGGMTGSVLDVGNREHVRRI
jgi:hypothetical protein